MRRKRAFFPVSLSNDRFSTRNVAAAISQVLERYREIYVLIADRIQIYNRIAANEAPGKEGGEARLAFATVERGISDTLKEREQWMNRLRLQLGHGILKTDWKVYSVADISDSRCYDILRRVLILDDVDAAFRGDVDAAASEFVASRAGCRADHDRQTLFRMSRRYILEEAALSLRIRVCHGLEDEYYIGKTSEPVANIYSGRYRADCWELVGINPKPLKFSFYEYSAVSDRVQAWHLAT